MSLADLTDAELLSRIQSVLGSRHRLTAQLLDQLAEVEARRLHLQEAYSSMYDFCLRKLGFSEGSAVRHIAAARTCRRFPAALRFVAEGRIHLTGMALLQNYLTSENHIELLHAAIGKSKAEIELLLRSRFPLPDVPERVRPLQSSEAKQHGELTGVGGTLGSPRANASPGGQRMTARERGHVAPLSADRFHAQFTMSAQTKDKLELALDLMSHSNPRRSLVAVFDRALDSLLQDLEKKRLGKTNRPRRSGGAKRGNISRATLRAVYERDGVRCSFVSESGARCISRLFLQTDHVVARAQGGSGELHNARILCGPHNRFEAEKTFGEAHVARRICERRERTRRDEGASEAEGAAEAAVAAAKTRGAAEAPEAEAALGAVSQPLAPATEAQATSTTLPSPVAVGWQAETAESSQRMAKRESSQRMAERESSQRMAKRESSQRMAKRESSQRMAKRAPPQRDASEVREMLFRALTTMGFRKSETNRALAQLEHRRSRTPDALWSERETLLEAPLDMLLREALALLMP